MTRRQRVFLTRHFLRWMRKTGLTHDALCRAVSEMAQGLLDADLGGGIFKKRVGLAGRGKSGGARTLVATNRGDRWFFMFGFAKNDRGNITDAELMALRMLASDLLRLAPSQMDAAIGDGSLQEICHDDQTFG